MIARLQEAAVICAGLLVSQVTLSPSQHIQPPSYDQDPRLLILERFFENKESPAKELARDFLIAADENGLDWRLLPSIAFVESGGGKDCSNNNIFGWDNGEEYFPSFRAGILIVANRLATSKLYKDKSLEEILAVYNPRPGYSVLVKSVMARLSTNELRQPAMSRL